MTLKKDLMRIYVFFGCVCRAPNVLLTEELIMIFIITVPNHKMERKLSYSAGKPQEKEYHEYSSDKKLIRYFQFYYCNQLWSARKFYLVSISCLFYVK